MDELDGDVVQPDHSCYHPMHKMQIISTEIKMLKTKEGILKDANDILQERMQIISREIKMLKTKEGILKDANDILQEREEEERSSSAKRRKERGLDSDSGGGGDKEQRQEKRTMGRGLLEVHLVHAKGLSGSDFLGKIDPWSLGAGARSTRAAPHRVYYITIKHLCTCSKELRFLPCLAACQASDLVCSVRLGCSSAWVVGSFLPADGSPNNICRYFTFCDSCTSCWCCIFNAVLYHLAITIQSAGPV